MERSLLHWSIALVNFRRHVAGLGRKAVRRAIAKANALRKKEAKEARLFNEEVKILPKWTPNQLRHSAATEIRQRYGLEAAQVTLGHAHADVTQVYAERDLHKAAAVMREVG